jgi:hypothetical protein
MLEASRVILSDLRRDSPRMASEAIERYVASSPLYSGGALPKHLYRDSRHSIWVLLNCCVQSALDTDEDMWTALTDALDRSRERVAEGLSIRDYLRCWQIGFEVLHDELDSRLGRENPDFWPVLRAMRARFDQIFRDAAGAYNLYSRKDAAGRDEGDAQVLDLVFAGAALDTLGIDPAPDAPAVILFDIGPSAAENTSDNAARELAGRRKARYVRGHLERRLPEVWLIDIAPRTGRLITGDPTVDLDELAAELSQIAEAEVTMAVESAADRADIPRANAVAGEVLATAVRCGRVGRASRIGDVALELHLAQPGPGLQVLIDRCAPMNGQPDLATTVRAYLQTGMDRRLTAELLHVHPNTVDNRLARIRAVTGLDVHRAADLLTLAVVTNPALQRGTDRTV